MKLLSFGLGFLIVASSAVAQIGPDTTGFGSLPTATFGGSSIPNGSVAKETFNGITLGLSATQRFSNNPAPANDGAGTFFVVPGIDTNVPSSAADPYARWNFNYFVGNLSAGVTNESSGVSAYNYRLFYDFNPTVGNLESTHGSLSFVGSLFGTPGFYARQGSLNLGMNYLAGTPALPGYVAPPSPAVVFDPTAAGEYSFKLAAYTSTGTGASTNLWGKEEFSTSMVVTVVPEPGEWAMMLAGLGVVSLIAKRRRKIAV